ncbi:LOW QUALITY PROTEIN: hypothetical protein Cgig2_017968 [Carnegiea gigantea]|uniref:Uncharacterized protein n=1 Tax=Carnegiea gigantea TaxID=171969 RepID=A0A9Q1QFH7_9CARY|nr:LOW QUALITY PROTEIN: hypothetical protein Cgig2_017968 [Carnegiea gigantea]
MKSVSYTSLASPLEKYNTTNISIEVESADTTHAHNAPLRRWRVGVRTSVYVVEFDRGLGNTIEEEGSRMTPSSAITPPRCGSAKAKSTGATHAANMPLRRWRDSLPASVFMAVLSFPAWFGQIRGLEGRRRKKAVDRRLCRRRVLYMCHPSAMDVMVEVSF